MIDAHSAPVGQHPWLHHHTEVGLVAALVIVASYVPYVRATLRGEARPNRVSWWTWALLGAISFVSYLGSGATASLWVPALAALGPLMIAILSLRFGSGGASRFDHVVLAGCAAGLALWWASGSAAVGLATNIAVDAVGALPTLRKSWRDPGSENAAAWRLGFLGSLINLFALVEWTPYRASYPLYLAAVNAAVVVALVAGRRMARHGGKAGETPAALSEVAETPRA